MADRYRIVRTRPALTPWLIGLAAAVAIVALWPRPDQAVGFRPLCEAQGGIVVHLEDSGRLCLWAGAVIPVSP
jgi:hypothetical protein